MNAVGTTFTIKHIAILVTMTLIGLVSAPRPTYSATFVDSQNGGYWIGNPTPSDYMGQHLGHAIADGVKLRSLMPQLEAQIARARADYFAPRLTTAKKRAAGDIFGELLWEKDLIYAQMYLSEGFTKHAQTMVDGLAIMSHPGPNYGGTKPIPALLDGGFPGDSWGEFRTWIRGLRQSMGAQEDGDLLLVADGPLKNALQANMVSYTAYRAKRDKGEYDNWNNRGKAAPPPLATPVKGAPRSAPECQQEATALGVVNYLRMTHLKACMAGYHFTNAGQVTAMGNAALMEMGRQINASRP